jgi:peptide/nickel transport system ATP-binding protein
MRPDTITPTLAVEDLVTHFPIRNAFGLRTGWLRALDGVTLDVAPGEVVGVVGESGCGKTTFGKTLCGIHRASGGRIVFQGEDATNAGSAQAKRLRRKLQYCYQDPSASLDPNWTIGRSLAEPLVIHTNLTRAERTARIHAALEDVGLPSEHLSLYPHEISGGQQRRVGLARILMLQPSLVVLDEPTAGLDLSVQARVLRLLMDLRERHALSYIFISHDLSVVRLICHRIAVMYLGRVVELRPADAIFRAPSHPYTAALLSALPVIGGGRISERFALEDEPPSPGRLPRGCRFRLRCPRASGICEQQEPELAPAGEGQLVACHFPLTE